MADGLRERLVLALLDALADGDPLLVIGVGDDELRVGWAVGGWTDSDPADGPTPPPIKL